MSTSSASQSHGIIPQSTFVDSNGDFVRWSFEQLGLTWSERDGICRLQLDVEDRAAFAGAEQVTLQLDDGQESAPDEVSTTALATEPIDSANGNAGESARWDSRFGRWLAQRLRTAGPALHDRPTGEPLSVNDIMARMFGAYDVESGNTHLAGCELTDHPFVRLSFVASDQCRVNHVYVAPDGSSVNDELVRNLGLDQVEPIADSPPRLSDSALRALVAAGRRIAAKQSSDRNPDASVAEPLAATVIWIRHVDGHLQFTVGEASATHDFSGWAKLLTPQPFVAPGSGASTFRLSATDDGRIDATEEIAVCEQSGRRVLRQELVECIVTGQHVLPEYAETCSVMGGPALLSEFAECPHCRQRVSLAAFEGPGDTIGPCQACRQLVKIRKDDPRLVWLLGEHPGLDRWNRWQLAETATVYIAQAASLTRRLLAVVDKETLAVRYLATGGLMNSGWAELSGGAREEQLR